MAQTPNKTRRSRPSRPDRAKVIAFISSTLSVLTTAAVCASVVVAHRPLVARAAALRQSDLKIAFDWPPLAGKTTSRTAGGEPATWMNAEQRAELESIAVGLLSGNPFDDGALARTQAALKATGWFADGPWLKRYENGVVVISGQWRIPTAAVRTPGGDRLVTRSGEALPLLYPQARSGMKVVLGVSSPEPGPGEKWLGGEVQAALELISFLAPMPGYDQVAGVDVSEFAAHKRLKIVTTTGGTIVWGGPPNEFIPGQASGELKRARLAAVYQQFGQLDAGRPQIDVRSEDGVYTHDATAMADPETADPAPKRRAGKNRR